MWRNSGAGERGAEALFSEGKAAGRKFPLAGAMVGEPKGFPVQCLMKTEDFVAATKGARYLPSPRVSAIDRALTAFHAYRREHFRVIGTTTPENWKEWQRLMAAVKTAAANLVSNPGFAKAALAATRQLLRQIALEEHALGLVVKGLHSVHLETKFSLLEEAHEYILASLDNSSLDFTWKSASGDLTGLMREAERTYGNTAITELAKTMANRDIGLLKKIAQSSKTPDVLKRIIEEVTHHATLSRVGGYQFQNPGISGLGDEHLIIRNTNDQQWGRKFRLGSLLHELTHATVGVKFGWPILFSVPADATVRELLACANSRAIKVQMVATAVQESNLSKDMTKEFTDKLKYPLSDQVTKYKNQLASNNKLDEQSLADIEEAIQYGLRSELVEYDTVINQMTLWCHLGNYPTDKPVYKVLLRHAQVAYQWRARFQGGRGGEPRRPGVTRRFP